MKKKLIIFNLVILIIIIILFAIILSTQEKYFFYPNFDEVSYNELKQDDSFKEVNITLKNGKKLSGWLKYNSTAIQAPLIIFFMGNAQNSSSLMHSFSAKGVFEYLYGYNVVSFDYPGYGLSEGKIKKDEDFLNPTLEIYDWAINQENVDRENIIVIGYSIGTGAATYLCSQRNVNKLVLLAPYDEALSLYNYYFNVFHGILEKITTFKLTSKEYAKSIYSPVLIFSSKTDEVISYEFSENLSHYFTNLHDFVLLENVGHNYYINQVEVWDRIRDFIHK